MDAIKPPFQRWKQYGAIDPPVSRGHRVIIRPSKSGTYTFFCHRAGDSRTLHFALRVHDDTSVILKVEEDTILSPPRLSLPHNDGGHRCTKISVRITGGNVVKRYALFFLSSGFPFFTDATTISPTPASGNLLRCDPNPKGSMINRDLAPLLSAQFKTAPTGRPRVMRNLLPEVPAPVHNQI